VTLQLAPGAYLETQVTDQDGHPLAGVALTAQLKDAHSNLPVSGKSDATGLLRVGPLPAGAALHPAFLGGYWTPGNLRWRVLDAAWDVDYSPDLKLSPGEHHLLPPLRLRPAGRTVRGDVTDAAGHPAPGVQVVGTGAADSVVTAADGSFTLPGLKSRGPVLLVAMHPTQALWAAAQLDPDGGEAVHLTLGALAGLTGQTLDAAGQPVNGGNVICDPQVGWGLPELIWTRLGYRVGQLTQSDDRGHWHFAKLLPGVPYKVTGWFDRALVKTAWERTATLKAGETLDLGQISPPKPAAPAAGAAGPPPPA
jgi:hypothetical protein